MAVQSIQGKNLNILLPESMLQEIDDFRFANKFPSRTEAIRFLIELALKHKPKRAK